MYFSNDSIEEFLQKHKIVYRPINMPYSNMKGFAYYKNNTYLVIVNKKYIQHQMELYGNIINILRNNFIYEDENKELHYNTITKIIKNLEQLCKEINS